MVELEPSNDVKEFVLPYTYTVTPPGTDAKDVEECMISFNLRMSAKVLRSDIPGFLIFDVMLKPNGDTLIRLPPSSTPQTSQTIPRYY